MTPDFDNINAADLSDDDRLKALYLEAVRRKFWPNNVRAVLEFFCFAEKALHDDKQGTPGKLFYALIKRKNAAFITQESESRALLRISSTARQELVDAAGGLNGLPAPTPDEVQETLFGRDLGYYHGIMMQCFLPQKPLADGKTRYVTSHGRASMAVQDGILADPDKQNTFMECAVPFGYKARLILPYIIGYAVIRNTPEVDLGRRSATLYGLHRHADRRLQRQRSHQAGTKRRGGRFHSRRVAGGAQSYAQSIRGQRSQFLARASSGSDDILDADDGAFR